MSEPQPQQPSQDLSPLQQEVANRVENLLAAIRLQRQGAIDLGTIAAAHLNAGVSVAAELAQARADIKRLTEQNAEQAVRIVKLEGRAVTLDTLPADGQPLLVGGKPLGNGQDIPPGTEVTLDGDISPTEDVKDDVQ